MLTHLHIKDFALVDHLEIELEKGLTVITGETGAGKSIMLDALGLTLGDRTDSGKVRPGCERADIHASFDISKLKFAQTWLNNHDLESHEPVDRNECILRRVITKEGRSRAFINGQTVTLAQLKVLGEQLIDIHNQHEHQSLLQAQTHRRLVDEFGNTVSLASQTKEAFRLWQKASQQLIQIQTQGEEIDARFQLLHYQVQELDKLNLEEGELNKLEKEQRLLSNSELTQENCHNIVEICSGDGAGLKDRLNHAIRLFHDIPEKPQQLGEFESLLQNALISIEEAHTDMAHFLDDIDQDPARLLEIDTRLNTIYDVARKHRIKPEDLVALHNKLTEELSTLSSGDDLLDKLEKDVATARTQYDKFANELTQKRKKACSKLANAVNKKFSSLAMDKAKLEIAMIEAVEPSAFGNEHLEFLICTNPGQKAQALQKVASGGELSRISLAIQVVTAQTSTTPTLVFDEVDVGIGGTTGDIVGAMLKELGAQGQIFCVTHLAQVASKAHQHFRVEKHMSRKEASSTLQELDGDEKIIEIARMMGGKIDSKASLDHAKQMLIETS